MLPTAGFIPPPVVPLVPAAVNSIAATGGLLAGVGASAAAGAKAGAVLGPKGAVVGAVAGALLLPLLLPQPTADGEIEGPIAQPIPTPPDPYPPGGTVPNGMEEYLIPSKPGDAPGTVYSWTVSFEAVTENGTLSRCSDGSVYSEGYTQKTTKSQTWNGAYCAASSTPLSAEYICAATNDLSNWKGAQAGYVSVGSSPTSLSQLISHNGVSGYQLSKSYSTGETPYRYYVQNVQILRNGEPVSLPGDFEPQPDGPVWPKPEIQPLAPPAPLPFVPAPEVQPLIEPLVAPSPDNPEADPIEIPEAPPAEPIEVPGPETDPLPQITPAPDPVPLPSPIPSIPPITEPSVDPEPSPAPGPSPDPVPGPGPVPAPSPEPDPSTFPPAVPPVGPDPGPITTPVEPEAPEAVDPGSNIVPVPQPDPTPTNPNHHFPVSGGPSVTPGGTRPDLNSIAAEVGRIEQKVANIQGNKVWDGLTDLLWLLPLLADFLEGDIPGTTYNLQGVCESVGEGEDQPIAEFPVPPAKNLSAVIDRIDALPLILQQHLAWKTPICDGQPQAGDWRTVTFISDELSPGGKRRLDKRLRYRSQSSLGLGEVVDHWAGFAWQAGPVLVKHVGAWWGTPRVWASSSDEGKRVLRHAAGEAGFDPDQIGRWEISGSGNPRLGAPGTMRVNTKGGYYWITARDGSDERPIVSKT